MPAFSPKLGHYELRGVLGCRGHGSVQRALDTSSGREVALKILIDATDADRPLREIRAAALLDHPGIARIYETGEENGRRFIAMELVEGSTLESILGKGPLPLATAIDYSIQTLSRTGRRTRLQNVHSSVARS